MENIVYRLPSLVGVSSKGKGKLWEIVVIEVDGEYKLKASSGYIGKKITNSYSSAILGKNIGRSNETTPLEQAIAEATSKWQKKLDDNYIQEGDDVENRTFNLLPMLAHKYKDRKHNIVWPAAAQPKLNGVRCIAKKISEIEIEYTSRGGKKYTTLEHLTPTLLAILNLGQAVDGELYIHGVPLQELTSAVKRGKTENPLTKELEYWVYDVVDTELDFNDRFLKTTIRTQGPIVLTPTLIVNNEEEFLAFHKRSTASGFEGSMIRNINSKYVLDYRSIDLQKHKDFKDAEFTIVGGEEASGEDEGTVVFTCVTEQGKTFNVRPEGTREQRRRWYFDLHNIVGKKLTVRYQDLTVDGIPQFPVGVVIRDYE